MVVAPSQGLALMETPTVAVTVSTPPEDSWANPGGVAADQTEGLMDAKRACPGEAIPQGALELLSEDTGIKGIAGSRVDPPRKRVWLSEAAGGPKARRRKGNPPPGRQRLEEWLLAPRDRESTIGAGLVPQAAVAAENPAGVGIGRKAVISGMSGAEVGPGEGWASTVSETASQARTAQASPGVAWDAKQLSEREEKLIAPLVVVRDLVGHDDVKETRVRA